MLLRIYICLVRSVLFCSVCLYWLLGVPLSLRDHYCTVQCTREWWELIYKTNGSIGLKQCLQKHRCWRVLLFADLVYSTVVYIDTVFHSFVRSFIFLFTCTYFRNEFAVIRRYIYIHIYIYIYIATLSFRWRSNKIFILHKFWHL